MQGGIILDSILKDMTYQSKTQSLFHKQIIFGTSFTFLTSGVFLSGLAMYMGASDLLVSYISMIVNICGISIIVFSSVIERFNSYKKITISLTVLSKLTTLLIVLIPLLIPDNMRLAVFVPVMIAAFTLQSQTTVVLNNWLVTFVDEKQSGRYIAKRQTYVLIMTVILSLTGGRLLDKVSGQYIGFAILFFAAFIMAALEVLVLFRIPDAKRQKSMEQKISFKDLISVPSKCKPFFHFVVYIFLFYLFLSIADSFTVVYMMRYLCLSYTATTAMQMIISLPQIFMLGIWGKISDKRGHRFALTTSICFFVGETFFMALSNMQNNLIMIPLAFLFASVGNSGFVVSVFNRRYELMPKQGRILYDNFFSAAVGLAFILGPVIGGAIRRVLESVTWVNTAVQFGNIRLLYAISTVALILLQIVITVQNNKKIIKQDEAIV